MSLSAPFPYFGGKSRWSDSIWDKFGRPDVYIEPFSGSLAVLLANRHPAKREVVCDKDGLICNFWRAITADPEQTAHWADWPTIHQDLTARHKWLKQWAREHSSQLSENSDYYDAKAAGWWVWGISLWIGGGWCSVESSKIPHIDDKRFTGSGVASQRTQIPMVSDRPGHLQGIIGAADRRGGSPVTAQSVGKIPKITGNRASPSVGGVSVHRDQIPCIAKEHTAGQGVSAQRENISGGKRPAINAGSWSLGGPAGVAANRINRPQITDWFQALADRLKRVIVLNRDWKSAVTSSVLADTPSGPGEKINRCVFLDPPYRTEKRSDTLYSSDIDGTSDDAAVQSYEWAVKHGEKYRIAYCSHEEDFPVPDGWDVMTQAFKGVRTNRDKSQDCIMFSPACEDRQPSLFSC